MLSENSIGRPEAFLGAVRRVGPFTSYETKPVPKYRITLAAFCAMTLSLWPLFAQGMTVVGSGYATPTGAGSFASDIRLAPGQIVTLFVSNTTIVSSSQQATTVPLPAALAGFSVTIRQLGASGGTFPAALLSVQPFSLCESFNIGPGCQLTMLTVQVPFEMVIGGDTPRVTDLIVNDNGTASVGFRVAADEDHIHVLTTCETQGRLSDGDNSLFQPCSGVVTHADGSLVSSTSPAKAGEVVVIYAVGLGPTSPAVKTGTSTPTPAPALAYETLFIQFDFRPNAVPSHPYFNPPTGVPVVPPVVPGPLFAGLTPGQVGLYQVNVRIPDALPQIPPCTDRTIPGPLSAFVQTNLTIDIGGVNSFDGAAICVQPPPQSQPAVNLAPANH